MSITYSKNTIPGIARIAISVKIILVILVIKFYVYHPNGENANTYCLKSSNAHETVLNYYTEYKIHIKFMYENF